MTLIMAIKAKDGIVMASDTQAVGISSGGSIRYEFRKIFRVGRGTLFGASGTIGMIQKGLEVVAKFADQLDEGMDYALIKRIKSELIKVAKDGSDFHKAYHGEADGVPTVDILLVGKGKAGEPRILHIAKDCHDEFLDDIGYKCVGSGDVFGLASLRGFYDKGMHTNAAKMLAYKAVMDSIGISGYGLGGTADIWVIDSNGKIGELPDSEVKELATAYETFKSEQRKLLARVMPGAVEHAGKGVR